MRIDFPDHEIGPWQRVPWYIRHRGSYRREHWRWVVDHLGCWCGWYWQYK